MGELRLQHVRVRPSMGGGGQMHGSARYRFDRLRYGCLGCRMCYRLAASLAVGRVDDVQVVGVRCGRKACRRRMDVRVSPGFRSPPAAGRSLLALQTSAVRTLASRRMDRSLALSRTTDRVLASRACIRTPSPKLSSFYLVRTLFLFKPPLRRPAEAATGWPPHPPRMILFPLRRTF